MFKSVQRRVWAFDAEWIPDPLAAQLLHDLPCDVEDRTAMEALWRAGGATAEDPTPFLKLAVCRVVSIAAVERIADQRGGKASVRLMSLPRDSSDKNQCSEAAVLSTFLGAAGEHRPQLVGFNSLDSDLKIFIQRALILGITAPKFCARPAKPWEGVDYFAKGGEWNVDIKDAIGGWGKATPSLHQLAVQCGVPGKMDVDGNAVADLWLAGRLDEIVAYNECDALTTYLVWLRTAHLGGFFDTREYEAEQAILEELLEGLAPQQPHLGRFLTLWRELREIIKTRSV
ncbi:MAG: putative PolB exonuclease-like 3'-5' exonuclease [Hyphomicrobiaceae bacterium]|jgi:predicted PolB exonuclease-like 3'-5' exonuclease